MSEAPKETWLGHGKAYIVPVHGTTSYTLTTHAQAMVAAERDACAQVAKDAYARMEKLGLESPEDSASRSRCFGRAREAMYISETICARTTADERAALNALLKAERVKGRVDGLREAADRVVRFDDPYLTCRAAILALIEKETGHE